eukprot:IDg20107t1
MLAFAFAYGVVPVQRCRRSVARFRCSLTAPDSVTSALESKTVLPEGQSHFLHVDDWSSDQLRAVLHSAQDIKKKMNDPTYQPLFGKAMSMVFAKPSARTRVSFETGMFKLGGHALCLGPEVGVGTREAPRDVARVLAGMTDVVMARLYAHGDLIEIAAHSRVPVINGLTDYNHPCQIVADALTVIETRGELDGAKVVYVGDGNNIVHSWLELAARLPLHFVCCCPTGFEPDAHAVARAR